MRRFCVIGDPVGHSLSPALHAFFLRELGLDGTYGAVRVPAGETAAFLIRARAEFSGFNATMPHKTALLPLLDRLTPQAQQLGAVNTVRIQNGITIGHNTDGIGFLRAASTLGFDPAGKTAALLGAGGAARALALTLARHGARVLVVGRTAQRVQNLCALSPCIMPAAAEEAAAQADLLVNATPCGMEGSAERFESLAFLRALPPQALVCDLVYAPRETALLREAAALGHDTQNGLAMLAHQALESLAFFLGRPLDPALAQRAIHALFAP